MSVAERSDEELVEIARSSAEGDLRAYDELVKRWQGKILTNCRFLTRSPDDSEDLAQEVFVKAFFHLGRFEGRSSFGTWIRRIKVNHCLNFVRSRGTKTFVDADDEVVSLAPELQVTPTAMQGLEAGDQREAIRAVLDELPDTLRVPLLLRDLDGMSYQEISDTLDLGLSATKMRIKRAREQFRELYLRRTEAMETSVE
ncbi:MAG: sigma-70 family RNA polymerase sigma factor [Gemmatimonadetes bacterium]|nr:sigma-70 family RNA polymerase sigma factor [Gemmatimonadota bacterium]